MRGCRGVKIQLNTLFRQLWGACVFHDWVQFKNFFSASTKLVPLSEKMTDGVPRLPFDSHYTRTHFHGLCTHINMYSSCGHTCRKEAPSFLRAPPNWDVRRSKIINTTSCKGRLAKTKPFNWKLCHQKCDSFGFSLPACKAVDFNGL